MVRISQGQLNKIQLLNQPSFERLRDERLRPQFNLDGLRILRLQAGRERDLRELYRHRAPYELLQNADDVHATKALFVLSPEGLAFAHNGSWFTVENFLNLAEGWSDKEPSECIGHKGLGFRSVLDITPTPYLIKVNAKDFFAVKFTWALNNGHIQETLRRDSEFRQIYSDWTKRGQSCCPVMAIPGLVKKQSLGAAWDILDALIRSVYGDQFTTMFWFPARDPDINSAVLSELGPLPIVADEDGRECLLKFLEDEVSVILPFLAYVVDVKIYDRLSCIASIQMPPQTSEQRGEEITVLMKLNGESRSQSYFRMSFVQDIPHTIRKLPDTPMAIRTMGQARLSLLGRLENRRPVYDSDSYFYVYFPTKEPTGMGFVVHGDFYVKPDRTRLMKSGYNEWLLKCAARAAANEFLTTLLRQYPANSVFEVLSPSETPVSELGLSFRQFFAKALQERQEPFIPTNKGMLKRDEVLLPPTIDVEGFWETHFASSLGEVMKAKKAFLAPAEDGRRARAFLSLAQVDVLEPKSILDFIEVASKRAKDANWWYECYSYLANEEKLSRYDHSFFAGRRLVPASDSTIIVVAKDDGDALVSLPPTGNVSSFIVPKCFSAIFVFMDNALAQLLQSGEDTVRSWVLDRFHVSRFEATELLPRAIRKVAPQIFTGELTVTRSELITAWIFIKRITDASRMIQSPAFWEDIGRFPLPLEQSGQAEILGNKKLSPAFLSYWPDGWIEGENCLSQVEGLRRIQEEFLNDLVSESGLSHNEWQTFFSQAGASAAPKVLKYSRVVGDEELLCEDGKLDEFVTKGFRGEWQTDMNNTVVEVLRTEQFWSSTVASVATCSHNVSKVIQNLTLLEGFSQVTQKAMEEFQSGDDTWKRRLWALIKQLPLSLPADGGTDAAFCRGGGGHSLDVASYLGRQLNHYAWLPSSLGPANGSDCFLRWSTRRLISSGTSGDELGDKLLPYVAVDNIDEQARLQNLGVQVLDDADSASIPALIRALTIIGNRLSTEWGREEILKSPGRWRLVRGAIQEIYRRLNQYQGALDCPSDTKFATRSPKGVQFCTTAMYYAGPGSAVEQAFMGMLPLFDADRPYPQLFEQISVTRLQTTGERKTVEENLLAEDKTKSAPHLCDEIVNRLAPFLLAPIVAKSERQKDIELVVRRLRERFEVKTSDHLTVSFSLVEVPSVQESVDFPKFYLQRRVIPGPGAVEEAKYILYVAGEKKNSIINLDGDALGQALAPIFFVDRVSDDLAGIFPRIAYRYQQTNGKPDEMQEFMLYQLGISREAQDMATEVILGKTGKSNEAATAPPPPIKVITKPNGIALPQDTVEQTIGKHQQILGQKLTELVQGFAPGSSGRGEASSSGVVHITSLSTTGQVLSITAEQQNRGKRGEEEIKRRLQLPGGYDGFTLVADERDQGCGYDFLCAIGERQVNLEVKTFTLDGRVIVTSLELRAAVASQDDYYLIGVLDDGKPESEWRTFLIRNPIFTLVTKGEFDIEARLQAQASDVFRIGENK